MLNLYLYQGDLLTSYLLAVLPLLCRSSLRCEQLATTGLARLSIVPRVTITPWRVHHRAAQIRFKGGSINKS